MSHGRKEIVLLICLFRWFDVRLFGGLLMDMRRRYSYYSSDITDGLNLQCLATIVFLYFACITPIVTFGGMLGQTTDSYMVSTDHCPLPTVDTLHRLISLYCYCIVFVY